jgi:hypothetical protein
MDFDIERNTLGFYVQEASAESFGYSQLIKPNALASYGVVGRLIWCTVNMAISPDLIYHPNATTFFGNL